MGTALGLSPAQWGAIFITISVLCLFLGIFKRLRAYLVFLGICLTGGLIARLLTDVARVLSNLTDSLFGKLFGVAVPGVLVLLVGFVLVHDLHPKGGGASRRTYWLAVLAAACVVAGVSAFGVLNGIPASVHTGVSTVTGG